MPCAPVTITQRTCDDGADSSLNVALIASRIGWSSALRLAGLEIVSRRTPSAGSSIRSLPSASSRGAALVDTGRQARRAQARASSSLLEHDQRVALVDRLTLLAADLRHRARVLRLHRHLHLHRLQDRHRVALLHRVAHSALDFPYRAG